jgi:lysyl-tRNA synthetase class 2
LSIPPKRNIERFPPFWRPDRHAARRPRLLCRARALAATRAYFAGQGFIEAEPAALQVSPGNETHLHGFKTEMLTAGGERQTLYLHTSPEFAMKKLLAAGESNIFALSRVFRNRERGALHSPEFTMLEWYRVGEPPTALEADCGELIRLAAEAAGTKRFAFRGREADPFAEPERLPVREAFLRHCGIDIFDTLPAIAAEVADLGRRGQRPRLQGCAGEGDSARFAAQARAVGLRTAPDDSWSDVFSRLLSERVEPNLGLGRAAILCDYPASEAALAKLSSGDPRVAERFELYACGVELANAFGELTDADEQRRRFAEDMALKAKIYGESYPIDEDFLKALNSMPEASGAALGFDRLVMLACGAERIDDVQWTPVFDPEGRWG